MSFSTTRTNIILQQPSDWDEWIAIINSKAKEAGIKDLIDLKQTSEPPQLQEPTIPVPGDVLEGALFMKDLSINEREDLKYRCEVFRHEHATYRMKKEALQDIHNFILTTIDRQYILLIANLDSVYQILSALKKRLAPTDRARELEVTRQYRDLQNAPKIEFKSPFDIVSGRKRC